MKTKLSLLALIFVEVGVNGVFAQTQPATTYSQTATVYVYRSNAFVGSARKYWVYANGKPICKLKNHRHCQVSIPSGPVTFSTKLAGLTLVPKKRPALPLTLQPGQTYYLQADLKIKLLPPQAILPLTEVVANVSKLREINQSKAQPAFTLSGEE